MVTKLWLFLLNFKSTNVQHVFSLSGFNPSQHWRGLLHSSNYWRNKWGAPTGRTVGGYAKNRRRSLRAQTRSQGWKQQKARSSIGENVCQAQPAFKSVAPTATTMRWSWSFCRTQKIVTIQALWMITALCAILWVTLGGKKTSVWMEFPRITPGWGLRSDITCTLCDIAMGWLLLTDKRQTLSLKK